MGSYNFCINLLMSTSEDELISDSVCCCSELCIQQCSVCHTSARPVSILCIHSKNAKFSPQIPS